MLLSALFMFHIHVVPKGELQTTVNPMWVLEFDYGSWVLSPLEAQTLLLTTELCLQPLL